MLSSGLVVPEVGSLVVGEDSHVVVDNELVVMGVEQVASVGSFMGWMLQGKDGLSAGCSNEHS